MGRFEFRKHEIELDIAGVKASVPGDLAFVKRLEEIGKEMKAFGENMDDVKDIGKGTDFMLNILDDILGESTMDAIEAERTLDIYDCMDMFAYITKEVGEYHADRTAVHTNPVSVPVPQPVPMAQAVTENREARRARERAERRAARRK